VKVDIAPVPKKQVIKAYRWYKMETNVQTLTALPVDKEHQVSTGQKAM
jgi:hypothetical protein